MTRIDIAAQVIKQIQDDEAKLIEADFNPEDETVQEEKWAKYRILHQKIKPEWKPEDENALIQIKTAAADVTNDIFEASRLVLDRLYEAVREPVLRSNGSVARDENDRIIWQKDEHGNYIENWENLDAHQMDQTLFQLQDMKLVISQRIQELFLEAVFAKNIMQDEWHEAYSSVVQGTNPLREAKANRVTSDERWNYFFRFYIYSYANAFDQELGKMIALISRIRNWRIQEKPSRWD